MNKFIASIFLTATAVGQLAASSVTATFIGANGQTDASGNLISPYYGTIDSGSGADPVVLYCDDFANQVSPGQVWTANVTSLSDSLDNTNTRYGSITQTLETQTGTAQYNGLELYEMAAYLTTQLVVGAPQSGDVQDTIWDLFNPNAGNGASNPPLPSTESYLYAAEASIGTLNYSAFSILTNPNPTLTGAGQVQEFILVTPEPSTVFLLGLGLIAIPAAARRFSRRPSAAS